jgi:hypothetical protein
VTRYLSYLSNIKSKLRILRSGLSDRVVLHAKSASAIKSEQFSGCRCQGDAVTLRLRVPSQPIERPYPRVARQIWNVGDDRSVLHTATLRGRSRSADRRS